MIDAAAKLFREHGFDGVGIDAVMAEAGLTHGGFYKSFSSKDELIAEACRRVAEHSTDTWRAREGKTDDPLAALIGQYLSLEHCQESGSACLFATLAGDAARRDTPVRAAFDEGLKSFVDHIADLLPQACEAQRHETALSVAATMIGAVTIARASSDEAFARDVLAAASNVILALGDQHT
ncbi:MAG TPA: TetR/AcrR family transcriptional regulator [Acidisoma sp.]|nr:TetR/AcrR family transcriptional regulator [Acidisoma sp.]